MKKPGSEMLPSIQGYRQGRAGPEREAVPRAAAGKREPWRTADYRSAPPGPEVEKGNQAEQVEKIQNLQELYWEYTLQEKGPEQPPGGPDRRRAVRRGSRGRKRPKIRCETALEVTSKGSLESLQKYPLIASGTRTVKEFFLTENGLWRDLGAGQDPALRGRLRKPWRPAWPSPACLEAKERARCGEPGGRGGGPFLRSPGHGM